MLSGLLAACGDGGGGGQGGAGGAASSTSTGEGGSGGAPCHGDAAAWTAATTLPIACEKNSDCCVIVNGCTNAAQVVHSTKLSSAKSNWPYCDNECTFCVAPAIAVECANKECVGYQLPDDPPPADALRKDHCGMDPDPPLLLMSPGAQFVCGG